VFPESNLYAKQFSKLGNFAFLLCQLVFFLIKGVRKSLLCAPHCLYSDLSGPSLDTLDQNLLPYFKIAMFFSLFD